MKKSKSKSSNNLSYTILAIASVTALVLGYKYLNNPNRTAKQIGINEVAQTQSPVFGLVISPETTPLDLNFKTPVKIMINAGQTMQMQTEQAVQTVAISGPANPTPSPSSTATPTSTSTPTPTATAIPAPVSIPNKLIAATVEFTYDPAQLTITDLEKGDFFPNTFAAPKIDPVSKKVTFSFGVAPSDGGKSGSGVLATFNVQPKVAGKSVLSFGSYAPQPVYNCPRPIGDVYYMAKIACAQPMMYRFPGIITNTDIRAENIDGNMYAASFNGDMRKMYAMQADAQSQAAAGISKMYMGAEPTYVFITNPRTPSDIVDDTDVRGDQVNAQDYAQFMLDFNKTGVAGWIRSDINPDGKVNIGDFATLVKEWNL